MPDGPHLQAERAFVQANDREVDFCPFRGPGACLLRTDTIPLLAAEINPAFGGDQEQAHGPQPETNSSQHGIDGQVARCATPGNKEFSSQLQATNDFTTLQFVALNRRFLQQKLPTFCRDAENASAHMVFLQTCLYAILMGVGGSGRYSPTPMRRKRCQVHHRTRSSGRSSSRSMS